MAALPIAPDMYFSDFSFDLKSYSVIREGNMLYQYSGLENIEDNKAYIHFMLPCKIQSGDLLKCNSISYLVTKIDFDTYNGENALLKAFIVEDF